MAQDGLNRHVAEFSKPRFGAVDSATVIAIGDFLFLDTDDLKPAYAFTWDTDLATTQVAFGEKCFGVANQQSAAGEVADLRADQAGIVRMKCVSATFEVGDLVGLAKHASEDKMLNDTVVGVTNKTEAVGRVTQREAAAVTEVFLEIFPQLAKIDLT